MFLLPALSANSRAGILSRKHEEVYLKTRRQAKTERQKKKQQLTVRAIKAFLRVLVRLQMLLRRSVLVISVLEDSLFKLDFSQLYNMKIQRIQQKPAFLLHSLSISFLYIPLSAVANSHPVISADPTHYYPHFAF